MGSVFTVLFILAMSMIIVRVATVGLTLTGVSRDLAHFQALSAFSGSGFTTKESEDIVNHPIRRRIVMRLMLLGNAGIVIAIATVLRAFVFDDPTADDWYESLWFRMSLLLCGIVLLWLFANSKYVEAVMWKANAWALKRWTTMDVRDYTRLLRLAHDYAVSEMRVHEGHWVAGRSLTELNLTNEGVLVLGIERHDGNYLGSPRGTSRLQEGDGLILYGPQQALLNLEMRRADFAGNIDHMIAVTRQLDEVVEESKKQGAD